MKPKHIGTWVFIVTDKKDIVKYGKNGDTEFPYPPDDVQAVMKMAEYLYTNNNDTVYVMHVFDNGQIKTYDYPY